MITVIYRRRCRDCMEYFTTKQKSYGSKWSSMCMSCLRWEL